MDTRRLLLAAFLSLAVLILWQLAFPPPAPVSRPAPEVPPPFPTGESVASEPGARETEVKTGSVAEGSPREALVAEPIQAGAEETVEIETDRYSVRMTNRGAQILSFRLKRRLDVDGEPLELVRMRRRPPYPMALVDGGGRALPINEALFAVEREAGGGDGDILVFRYRGDAGQAVKRFTFDARPVFGVEVEVEGLGDDWGLLLGPDLRNASPEVLTNRFQRRSFTYNRADDVEELVPRKTDGAVAVSGDGLRWLGHEDNYFLTALYPQTPLAQVQVLPVLLMASGEEGGAVALPAELSGEEEDLPRGLVAVLQPVGDRFSATAYWGAKDYSTLRALPDGLGRTIRWGEGIFAIFGALSPPLLFGLRWIYDNVVQNWGWSIVLMTAAIKVVLFPLTHKSYVSMQKLQKLNPRMEAIRQKYRPKLKDKQGRPNLEMQRKMNEEMQGLFREEGVNPAGGCIPILLQIPVFIAFYNVLRVAVELWNAPWILWINDLSEPFWPLALVMGGTQFLQQRMTPPPPNPSQAFLIKSMPIIFTVFAIGFPSGLVLYWLTNNVLTIVQQGGYNRLKQAGFFGGEDKPTVPKGAVAGKGKSGAKKKGRS